MDCVNVDDKPEDILSGIGLKKSYNLLAWYYTYKFILFDL